VKQGSHDFFGGFANSSSPLVSTSREVFHWRGQFLDFYFGILMLNEDSFTVNPLSFNICKAYLQSIWLKIHSRAPHTSKTLNLQSGAQAARARSRDCTFLSLAFEAFYLDPICFLNLLIIIILCLLYPISFILIGF
jgi:hypothetical protein